MSIARVSSNRLPAQQSADELFRSGGYAGALTLARTGHVENRYVVRFQPTADVVPCRDRVRQIVQVDDPTGLAMFCGKMHRQLGTATGIATADDQRGVRIEYVLLGSLGIFAGLGFAQAVSSGYGSVLGESAARTPTAV